jgi:hypothetical protein
VSAVRCSTVQVVFVPAAAEENPPARPTYRGVLSKDR